MPWGQVLRCRPLLAAADHFFTTADLELRHDEREWDAVGAAIGVPASQLLLIRQVHRADVAVARRGRTTPWTRPEADVIISDDGGSAIGVRVADCAPILLADTRRPVVGAAHAGWRGTVAGAAAAAVRAMTAHFGSAPADLIAAIGPCLGACCGEVGDEVVRAFEDAGHGTESVQRWFSRGPSGRAHIDLSRANLDQLLAAGVQAANVHVSGLCTRTHSGLMHSYRARGVDAGRMAGVIRPGPITEE